MLLPISEKKFEKKLPTWAKAQCIVPTKLAFEQCSSEATAKYKSTLFSGKKILDLTGGLGIDSWQWSQVFDELFFVEPNPELIETTKKNYTKLHIDNVRFFNVDATSFLKNNSETFDLIYLDPSRRVDGKRVFRFEELEPNIHQIMDEMLDISGKILIKTSPLFDLKAAINELKYVSNIWVIASEKECKEVLYLLEKTNNEVSIICEDLDLNKCFHFNFQKEREAEVIYSSPLKFLYDPSSAVTKAGAFKSVAVKFKLSKLSNNTHLYTSNTLQNNFPGRCYEIKNVLRYNAKDFKDFHQSFCIHPRGVSDSIPKILKKLKIKEGNDVDLFVSQSIEGYHAIIAQSIY